MKEKPHDVDQLNEKKDTIAAGELFYDNLIAYSKPFISAIRFIIRFSPIGVFSILCGCILQMNNPNKIIQSLSLFITTCTVGFIIQGVIVLPLLRY
jgi:Na+/H+-dicarboxylate symporter